MQGIFQSDIIIRTAIVAALNDIRANPWVLDYAFASLPQDDLTYLEYGVGEIEKAKKWFQTTQIGVFMTPRIDDAKLPAISISLQESSETSDATLGDVHYEPTQALQKTQPLAGPMTPTHYNASTGYIEFATKDINGLILAPGMLLMDNYGRTYPILDVITDTGVKIDVNIITDFSKATIVGSVPQFNVALESSIMKEAYTIGCHVNSGESVHLTYLHSIVVFALLRYKQKFLEARGFEACTISSSDFKLNADFGNELVLERYVTITGMVRQYWPKDIQPALQSFVLSPMIVDGAGHLPNDTNPASAAWVGDLDKVDAIGGVPTFTPSVTPPPNIFE